MTGEDLRGRVKEIYTLMIEIDIFLSQQGKLTGQAFDLIAKIQENSNELFHLIPLKKVVK